MRSDCGEGHWLRRWDRRSAASRWSNDLRLQAHEKLDVEPPAAEYERAVWRVRHSERRMREAYLALEEAEQRSALWRELEHVNSENVRPPEGRGDRG
jgi:hypothetical protein